RPRAHDADHRLPLEIRTRVAHLLGPVRLVVARLPGRAEPALAPKVSDLQPCLHAGLSESSLPAMSISARIPDTSMSAVIGWPRRVFVVLRACLAVVVCYLDRVNLSVAIIPMAAEFGWNVETQGRVLSAFFVGYLLLQIVGGRLADRFGGKAVLGAGVVL